LTMRSDKSRSSWLLRQAVITLLLIGCRSVWEVGATEENASETPFDVIHYDARIEPDIARKTITGAVMILLRANTDNLASITLDCGELAPDGVSERGATLKFTQQAQKLTVWLNAPAKARETREIEIAYHGSPPRGIRFFPDLDQVYTIFSTSQWMVCVDAPEDRATFRLRLILPANLTAVANGRLINQRNLSNRKTAYLETFNSGLISNALASQSTVTVVPPAKVVRSLR
jgi:aminopeptidase N